MQDNEEPTEETKKRWNENPENWIWGIFYYNPEDPRLFPPKKIKELGWTINFANPNSVFLAFIIIGILCLAARRNNII